MGAHPAHSWHITTPRSPLSKARISPAVCVARSMGSVMTERLRGESAPAHHNDGFATTHRSILSRDMQIRRSTTEFITDVSSSSRLARCALHPGKRSCHQLSPGSTTRPTMPSLAPPRAPWSMTCTRSPLTSPSTQRCPPVEVLSLVATIHVTWLRSSPDARWPLPSPAVSVRARRSPGLTFLRVLPTIVWLLGFVGEIRGPEKPDRRPAVAVARVTRLRRSRGRNPARPPRVRQIFLDWSAPRASRATAFAAAERHDDVAIADIESRGDRPERCDPARYRLWGTGHGAVTDIFFTCLPCFSRRWPRKSRSQEM